MACDHRKGNTRCSFQRIARKADGWHVDCINLYHNHELSTSELASRSIRRDDQMTTFKDISAHDRRVDCS